MEWLLIFYFNTNHGSVSTERVKTYEECQSIGRLLKKDSALIEVKKLER